MNAISALIGKRIRLYRQAKKISLSNFAILIHKSKSTLSKYENGEITIDVDTLFEIASKLDVNITQLMQIVDDTEIINSNYPSKISKQYVYMYDGRINKIMRSIIEVSEIKNALNFSVTLFYNLPSFEKYENYKSLYFGNGYNHDFVTNYMLSNQSNKLESVFICVLNSLEVSGRRIGLISGISTQQFVPASAKIIVSDNILNEDSTLLNSLMLSRNEYALLKKYNMFMLER